MEKQESKDYQNKDMHVEHLKKRVQAKTSCYQEPSLKDIRLIIKLPPETEE